jgi:hypothetical protein
MKFMHYCNVKKINENAELHNVEINFEGVGLGPFPEFCLSFDIFDN